MESDQCITCEHYQMGGQCKAYPRGIPEKILEGELSHKEPQKGDRGIRYKRIKLK